MEQNQRLFPGKSSRVTRIMMSRADYQIHALSVSNFCGPRSLSYGTRKPRLKKCWTWEAAQAFTLYGWHL